MSKNWLKELVKGIALVSLLGIQIPSIITTASVFAEEIKENNEEILLDNDVLKVTAHPEETEEDILWHVTYQQKKITKKRVLTFCVYNENTPLPEENISLETHLNFVTNDGKKWRQKDMNNTEEGYFSFHTPKEKGWYMIFHDLEEIEESNTTTSSENNYNQEPTYTDLLAKLGRKVGPYELTYKSEKEVSKEETTVSKSENSNTSSTTQNDKETMTTEESQTDSDKTISGKTKESDETEESEVSYTGFRKAENTAVEEVTSGASQLVPKDAISVEGIFAERNTVGTSEFTDTFGEKHSTGLSPDNKAYYIAGENNRVSVFSTDEYRLNFDSSFKGKVYVSFGLNESDGMAFVMHNDAKTTTALTNSDKGGSLGVYGEDKGRNWLGFKYDSHLNAIQNSVAVEFDLHQNDSYDHDLEDSKKSVKPHVAYAFPSNQSSYHKATSSWDIINTSVALQHEGVRYLPDNYKNEKVKDPKPGEARINVKWYPFIFEFNKEEQKFTYELQSPDGTTSITGKVPIPYDELSHELKLSENQNKAYWGFTAANGSAGGMSGFAFSRMPVESKVNPNVYRDGSVITLDDGQTSLSEEDIENKKYAEQGNSLTVKTTYFFDSSDASSSTVGEKINHWEFYWDEGILPKKIDGEDNLSQVRLEKVKKDNSQVIATAVLDESQAQTDDDIPLILKNLPESFQKIKDDEQVNVYFSFSHVTIPKEKLDSSVDGFLKTELLGKVFLENTADPHVGEAFYMVKGDVGKLTLDAVPNFNFGSVSAKNILQNKEFSEKSDEITEPIESIERKSSQKGNPVLKEKTYDGNNEGLLKITNSANTTWNLKVNLGEFYMVSSDAIKGELPNEPIIGTVELNDSKGKVKGSLVSGNGNQVVCQSSETKEQHEFHAKLTQDEVKLIINPNDNGNAIYVGTYQATMTWTLENMGIASNDF